METERSRDPADGGGRGYLVLLVPFVALLALAVWLVGSGRLDALRAHGAETAREERALVAIDATPTPEAEELLTALETRPEDWPVGVRTAVARLLDRTDWPPHAELGAGRRVAARAPAEWSAEEREDVLRLLELFRLRRFPGRAAAPADR